MKWMVVLVSWVAFGCAETRGVEGELGSPDAGQAQQAEAVACSDFSGAPVAGRIRTGAFGGPQITLASNGSLLVDERFGGEPKFVRADGKVVPRPEGALLSVDRREGTAYIQDGGEILVWGPQDGEHVRSALDFSTNANWAQSSAGGWFCDSSIVNGALYWFDRSSGEVTRLAERISCASLRGESSGRSAFFEIQRQPFVAVAQHVQSVAVDAFNPEDKYLLISRGLGLARLIDGDEDSGGTLEIYGTSSGELLHTVRTDRDSFTAFNMDFQDATFTHAGGWVGVSVFDGKATVTEVPGERLIAQRGARMVSLSGQSGPGGLLIRSSIANAPVVWSEGPYEEILFRTHSMHVQFSSTGRIAALVDSNSKTISVFEQTLDPIEIRYQHNGQLTYMGDWDGLVSVFDQVDDRNEPHRQRLFRSRGELIDEFAGLSPVATTLGRVVLRKGERVYIFNPQSGAETTLATVGGEDAVEFVIDEERGQLVLGHGCLDEATLGSDLGPYSDWTFRRIDLPAARFTEGGS